MLVSEGYDIGQSTIRPYIREKLQAKKEAYIKQLYQLGDWTEFDFGEVKCLITQQKRTLTLAVFSCPAYGYRCRKFYESSNQQVFLDAHICFFEQLKDVYSTVVYDNMRNLVKRFVGRHKNELNDELLKMALYYRFEPVVTNPFSVHEKRSCRENCTDFTAKNVHKTVLVWISRISPKTFKLSSTWIKRRTNDRCGAGSIRISWLRYHYKANSR